MIRRAQSQGPDLGRFMEALLSGTVSWAKLRQAQKLLRLGTKYGWPRLNSACRHALAFELINVHRVESILLQDPRPVLAPHGPGPRHPGPSSQAPLPAPPGELHPPPTQGDHP